MLVAITGGTGFIGKRLVSSHLKQGHKVRVLTRHLPSNNIKLPERVHFYQADLTRSVEELIPFVNGADVLYHCAGEIRDTSRMHAVHIKGTQNLLKAANQRIKRWVQLSSVGVYGPIFNGIVTEETPLNPVGVYEKTKTESDKLVIEAGNHGYITFSILRPSIIYGSEMPNSSLFQMISMIDKGIFFFIGKSGAIANYIHVDNVVEALIRCGKMPEAEGQIYNLSDKCTLEEFVSIISRNLRKQTTTLRIPEAIVRPIVRSISWLPKMPLTISRVNALTSRCVYSEHKIEQQLGYVHRISIQEGLSQLVYKTKKDIL